MKKRRFLLCLGHHWLRLALFAAILAAGSPPVPARAAGDPLSLSGDFGGVLAFSLSPNGQYAVFLADPDGDAAYSLYRVAVSGGAPVALDGPFDSGTGVTFVIAPDSSRVVYQATPAASPGSPPNLYSLPIAGGTPIPLNGLRDLGLSSPFQISADSQYVVFLVLSLSGEHNLLYRNTLLGGELASISPDGSLEQTPLREVVDFQLTPDGTSAYFRAYDPDPELDNAPWMLLRANLNQAAWQYLVSSFVEGSDGVAGYQIGSDSETVVFAADKDTENVVELYRLYEFDIPPHAVWKLNSTLVSGTDVDAFAIAPDSSRVAYTAAQAASASPGDESAYQLFGAVEVFNVGNPYVSYQLNGSLVEAGDVFEFRFSADSSRVVYLADQDTDETFELYSVSSLNNNSVEAKLNASAEGQTVRDYELTPDSSQVVYVVGADSSTEGPSSLYRAPLAGGASTVLDTPVQFAYNPDVSCAVPLSVTPDSQRAIYLGYAGGEAGIHGVSLSAGAPEPEQLSGDILVFGCGAVGELHPDSQRVLFMGFDPADPGAAFQLWVTEGLALPFRQFVPLVLR